MKSVPTWKNKSPWYIECSRTGRRISKATVCGRPVYTLWSGDKSRKVIGIAFNAQELKGVSLNVS